MTTIDQPDSGKAGAEAMAVPRSLTDATELESGWEELAKGGTPVGSIDYVRRFLSVLGGRKLSSRLYLSPAWPK